MEVSSIAEKAIRFARGLGADSAEAYVLKQEGTVVRIEQGGISSESVQEIGGIGIRVLKGKAFGFSHIDKLEEEKVEKTVETAFCLAKASVPDPNNSLPHAKHLPKVEGIYDKKIVDLQVEDAVKLTKDMLDAALGYDPRVRVDMGGIESRVEEEALANTDGIDVAEKRTFLGAFIWGMAKENGEITSSTEDYGYSHKLDLKVEEIGSTFAERAVTQFGAKEIGSFEGPAILDFVPTVDLVGSSLVFGVKSDNVQRNASPLRGKIGSELAVPQLNVIDDGLLKEGMMTKAFDDEGNPRQKTPILEKGILKSFLFDTYTSKKEGRESTGNASRRRSGLFSASSLPFESPPQLLPSNLLIEPGSQTKEQLVEEVDKGIFVGRFAGNIEFSNGNFSGSVKQGFLIENGETKHPLIGVMISGNSYTLMKTISGLSKEFKAVESSGIPFARSPMVRVEKIKITGKT